MFLAILWLVAINLACWKALQVWPSQVVSILAAWLVLTVFQAFTITHMLWRKYRRAVEVGVLVREAEDAMEEAMREPGDNAPLTRFQGLSIKPTKDMTADELLDHMRKLHGSHHPY